MHNKLSAVLLAILLLTSCAEEQSAPVQSDIIQKPSVRTISPREAAELLEQRKDMLVLDVRTPGELSEGSIERSMLTPFWSLTQGTMNLPQNRPIMLISALGSRSHAAGQLLVRNGFPEVYSLRGGMVAWKHAGLPVKYRRPGPGK